MRDEDVAVVWVVLLGAAELRVPRVLRHAPLAVVRLHAHGDLGDVEDGVEGGDVRVEVVIEVDVCARTSQGGRGNSVAALAAH